jgi:hypothetical protein
MTWNDRYSLRQNWKRADPDIVRNRSDLAGIYRRMRKDRPEMVRLMYRAYKVTADELGKAITAQLYSSRGGSSGLDSLFK